jgi:hypothetical protein
MGWDYWTYMNQPTWFVNQIIKNSNDKNKQQEALNKKRK